jgi:hypothetical protein
MPRLSTADPAQSRHGTLTKSANQTFTLSDVRLLASDPALLADAAAWARVHHPRTTLARAA